MKVKSLSLVIVLAFALAQKVNAYDGPVDRGTFQAIGERGTISTIFVRETDRKVKHSDTPSQVFAESSQYFVVFEDGSWILDSDGIPNTQDGIFVTWDETGCYDWGICE